MGLCNSEITVEPRAAVAWAAGPVFRGDKELFARIAHVAREAISASTQDPGLCIELKVRDDVERFDSAADFVKRVTPQALRSFRSARIRTGDQTMLVDVRFGRRDESGDDPLSYRRGVTVETVSNRDGDKSRVADVTDKIAEVLKRGGFEFLSPVTVGPTHSDTDLEAKRERLTQWRTALVQAIFFTSALLVMLAVYVGIRLLTPADDVRGVSLRFESFRWIAVGGATFANLISRPLTLFLFPAVEIADVTPGRRIARVLGRSGVVTRNEPRRGVRQAPLWVVN